jgi:hypothetical protein
LPLLGALLLIGVIDKSILVAGAFSSNKSKSLEKFKKDQKPSMVSNRGRKQTLKKIISKIL